MDEGPQLLRLGKTALIYGMGGALTRLMNFLFLPVFTAYLTPVDYGVTSILGWMTFLISSVFSLGLGAAIAPCYFEGDNPVRKEGTISTALALLLLSTVLLSILGTGLSPALSRLAFGTDAHAYLVALSLLSIGPSLLSMPLMLALQFEEHATAFVGLTFVTTLASVGLSLLTVVVLNRGVQGVIEAGLIAQIFTLAVFLLPLLRTTTVRLDPRLGVELLRTGVPLIPSFLFLFVLQVGNRYILEWSAGLTAVGIYTVGYNLGLAMNLFVSAFQSAWMPYFMSFLQKRDEAQVVLGRVLTYYTFGFGLVSLLFFVLAKPVVMVMTQPPFHEAYKVVGLSAAAYFLVGAYYILLPGMYFAKELSPVSLCQMVAAVLAVGANAALISFLGLLGAGIALVLGFVALIACTHLWNLYRRGIYLEVRYEWSRLGAFMVVYLAYAVGMLWDRHLSLAGEIGLSFLALVSLPPVAYLLLRGSEREMIWQSLKQLRAALPGWASANTPRAL